MVEFAIGGFNIGTDLIILLMPVPVILGLQMDRGRKLGLLVIFGTGTLSVHLCRIAFPRRRLTWHSVFASTIVREVIVVRTLRDFDQSWVTVPETVWL